LCLLCRVVSQIPLQRLVANKSATATSPSKGKLQTCWQQVVVVEFGKRRTGKRV